MVVPKQKGMKNQIEPAMMKAIELFLGEVVAFSCQYDL
jgi:hypothetical protein